MKNLNYSKTVLIIGIAGVLFSGYLSGVKFFTSTCALSEPCPYFLGYPACYFGFLMFAVLFVSALLAHYQKVSILVLAKVQSFVSALGILFAGYFVIPEIGKLLAGTRNYSLGLPTCAYGLIFYIIVFFLSVNYLRNNRG